MEKLPKDRIVTLLKEADIAIKSGATIQQACTRIGIDEVTFNDWQREYGDGLSVTSRADDGASAIRVEPSKRFWLIEIWNDYREIFKAVIAHSLIFGLLLVLLSLSHVGIDNLNYPQERKELFDKIHFYGYVVLLVIFVVSFIVKVCAFEVKGVRK